MEILASNHNKWSLTKVGGKSMQPSESWTKKLGEPEFDFSTYSLEVAIWSIVLQIFSIIGKDN